MLMTLTTITTDKQPQPSTSNQGASSSRATTNEDLSDWEEHASQSQHQDSRVVQGGGFKRKRAGSVPTRNKK